MINPIEMNGRVNAHDINGNNVSLFFKRFMEINLLDIIVSEISKMFNIDIIMMEFDITFLVFLPELISLLIASWILKLAIDSIKEKVGIINE